MNSRPVHGGSDSLGVPRFDFSSNSNACGPCPMALQALQQVDVSAYPDADYTELRQQLAAFHGVSERRIVLAGSASEFIMRVSAVVARSAGVTAAVYVPALAYGDYRHAARSWGLLPSGQPDQAQLVWACEPSSPLGQAHIDWPVDLQRSVVVLDGAYASLRLSGKPSLNTAQLNQVWQLYTPNKALGLTGVRAAYVIAPCASQSSVQVQIEHLIERLQQVAASWPVGAHGVAMLQAWVNPQVQAWLADCMPQLRDWKVRQIGLLESLGWQVLPSEANFFCARSVQPVDLRWLRENHGIKLRDASSFGLPGWLRLGVLGTAAQDALRQALESA